MSVTAPVYREMFLLMSIDILLSFSADAILSMRSVSRKCEIFFSFIFLSKLVVNFQCESKHYLQLFLVGSTAHDE